MKNVEVIQLLHSSFNIRYSAV